MPLLTMTWVARSTPLVLGELRGDAPAGIVFIHAPRHSPLHPNRGVGDHDDPRPIRSHDRRNRELDHHGGFPSLVGTAGDLGAYRRMGDRFEFLQLLRVGEDNGGQRCRSIAPSTTTTGQRSATAAKRRPSGSRIS